MAQTHTHNGSDTQERHPRWCKCVLPTSRESKLTFPQASGNICKIILDSLITSSEFNITILSRKESEATFPAGVSI